jgi:hypothetical protein
MALLIFINIFPSFVLFVVEKQHPCMRLNMPVPTIFHLFLTEIGKLFIRIPFGLIFNSFEQIC